MSIEVGDRVTWLHRWYWQEDEQMVGTVIELRVGLGGVYAWISVENEQSPMYARLDRLTKLAALDAAGEQDAVSAVQATVSSLAIAAIEQARSEGHTITIPSLGISIPPDAAGERDRA